MKKTFLLNIIFLFLFTSCTSQNKRIEKEMMECSYQAYSDNGAELKKLISNYQKLLIEENLLADSSAVSYWNFFKELSYGKEFKHVRSQPLFEKLLMIEPPNRQILEDCQSAILKDSAQYDMTKFRSFEDAVSSVKNSGKLRPSLIAQQILSVLSVDDFKLDYYRLRTLLLFDNLNMDYGIQNKLRTATGKVIEQDLSKALEVKTNEKNEIFVNGQKVSIEQLKSKVKDYIQENKNSSVISISSSKETMYKTYVDVQNTIRLAIQNLRYKSAMEKYQREYEKLNDEQKKDIKEIYTMEIVITTPE